MSNPYDKYDVHPVGDGKHVKADIPRKDVASAMEKIATLFDDNDIDLFVGYMAMFAMCRTMEKDYGFKGKITHGAPEQ